MECGSKSAALAFVEIRARRKECRLRQLHYRLQVCSGFWFLLSATMRRDDD
jgi:hypothetical protein